MEILLAFYNLLKSLFETHPGVDEFHVTSNGQAFFTDHHADAHAQSLRDKTVTVVTRDAVENFDPADPEASTELSTSEPAEPVDFTNTSQSPLDNLTATVDASAAPVADVPATPVADVPAAPVADVPATPVADVPAAPVADVPAAPVADVPATPVADVPATPVADAPAAPVADAPAETAEEIALEQSIADEEKTLEANKAELAKKKNAKTVTE